jgi:hypothetical protein
MSLTNTNALIAIQDGSGAVVNLGLFANATYTPGTTLTFSLQSTGGVFQWNLKFNCPAFPDLHGTINRWNSGQANAIQVRMPAYPSSGSNTDQSIQVISEVSDGQQTVAAQYNFLNSLGNIVGSNGPLFARALATTLPSYTSSQGVLTATSNGALGSIDGVAVVVGDLVFVANSTTITTDVGIYQVVSVGSSTSKWVLSRAPSMPVGASMQDTAEVSIGNEGTLYGGTHWFNDLAGINVVGTASFTFFPESVTQQVILAAGVSSISNVPVKSTTTSNVFVSRITANTTALTVTYQPVGGFVAGPLGLGGVEVEATVAAGTVNVADLSTLNVTITNQV